MEKQVHQKVKIGFSGRGYERVVLMVSGDLGRNAVWSRVDMQKVARTDTWESTLWLLPGEYRLRCYADDGVRTVYGDPSHLAGIVITRVDGLDALVDILPSSAVEDVTQEFNRPISDRIATSTQERNADSIPIAMPSKS